MAVAAAPPSGSPARIGDLHRMPPGAWTTAVFVCAALLIVVAGWPVIHAINVEIGDFAANSLLIQDAKSFALWKGNYSRIGFNHPGPAILYVLAFGEVVFHDWLHLVRSPFSGQLVAVALYNAFWIAMIARFLATAVGDRKTALLATAAFCFAATLIDHDVAGGAWFPHLYFFPFAALLVVAARTVAGATDALPMFATSAGFLVNGHVSFVVIVTVIVAIVGVANFVRFRKGPADRRIIGSVYLRLHARRLALTVGLFVLFLVPLVVETLRAWPGPVAAYLGYGSGQPPQQWADVLVFVGVYWGGLAPAAGAIATMAYLCHDDRASPVLRAHMRSIATVAVAATVAMFVYGRYGVDDLKYRYVGLFYYVVPALIVAITVVAAISVPVRAKRRSIAVTLTVVACIAGSFVEMRRRPFYVEQYNEPDATALYQSLVTASSGNRILLDLDTRAGFDYLWTRLVGAEAIAKRRGDVPFCIRKNWHVLFTEASKCNDDDAATAPRYVVRTSGSPAGAAGPPAFSSVGLQFFRLALPDLSDAGLLTVAANPAVFDDSVLDDGWSVVESDHAWTIASKATIVVPLRAGFRGVVTLELDGFVPRDDSTQSVTLRATGGVTRTLIFTPANRRMQVVVPMVLPAGTAVGNIELLVRSPISPRKSGVGMDPRLLGVSLRALEIRKD